MHATSGPILVCPDCGAKNRIPVARLDAPARCGRCHAALDTADAAARRYTLRCTACGTKNRVLAARLADGAKCGKCAAPLQIDELFAPQPMMISDMNFDEKVLGSPLPVLLYAWSPS